MTKLALKRRRRELGRGGSGVVHVTSLVRDGRRVAVKALIGTASSERLRREAAILAKLEHDNVVRFYGLHEDKNGQLEMVFEFVDGVTLEQLRRYAPLPGSIALYIIREVLIALRYLHTDANIVHRDLSPRNILLGRDGRVKIADFGLAKLQWAARTTRLLRCTPPYVSPEQLRPGRIDARSDLFVVGVLFYELLTGVTPYDCAPEHTTEAIPITPVSVLRPTLGKRFDALLARMLDPDRDGRPDSAEQILDELAISPCGADGLSIYLSERSLVPARGMKKWRPRLNKLAQVASGMLLGAGGFYGYQALTPPVVPFRVEVTASTTLEPLPHCDAPVETMGPTPLVRAPAPKPRKAERPAQQKRQRVAAALKTGQAESEAQGEQGTEIEQKIETVQKDESLGKTYDFHVPAVGKSYDFSDDTGASE